MIDREGRVAAVHVGLVNKSDYQHDILNLLEAPSPERGGIAIESLLLRTK